MAKKLSERLAYLMADNGIKGSNGLLQDLQDLESLIAVIAATYPSDIHEALNEVVNKVGGA